MREHQHAAERIIRDAEEMKAKGRTLPGWMSDALRLAEHYIGEPSNANYAAAVVSMPNRMPAEQPRQEPPE
jgi:hypothetical protein